MRDPRIDGDSGGGDIDDEVTGVFLVLEVIAGVIVVVVVLWRM